MNKINSPNFFFGIRKVSLKTQKQPSTKEIIKTIETELAKYDPYILEQKIKNENALVSELTNIQYDNDDIYISLYLIPKSPSIRGKAGSRPIGIYPFVTHWGGSEDTIKAALEKKANRYGDLGKPYIICVNSLSGIMTNEYDLDDAICGIPQILYSTDPANRDFKYIRAKDGFFLDNKGVRHTDVSGILITRLHLGDLHDAEYWLYKHPFAKYELDFGIVGLSYSYVSDNQIKKAEHAIMSDILSMPNEWIDK